jgi:hypothetical protein
MRKFVTTTLALLMLASLLVFTSCGSSTNQPNFPDSAGLIKGTWRLTVNIARSVDPDLLFCFPGTATLDMTVIGADGRYLVTFSDSTLSYPANLSVQNDQFSLAVDRIDPCGDCQLTRQISLSGKFKDNNTVVSDPNGYKELDFFSGKCTTCTLYTFSTCDSEGSFTLDRLL